MTNFRDPSLRNHFVYRAYDANDYLLYVGCTLRPEIRKEEHRSLGLWYQSAVRFRLAGPYNYDTARRLERDAVRAEGPIWNFHEPRHHRIHTLRRRIQKRHFQRAIDQGKSLNEAIACIHAADHLIPELAYDRPLTDMDVARAERAERLDAERVAA